LAQAPQDTLEARLAAAGVRLEEIFWLARGIFFRIERGAVASERIITSDRQPAANPRALGIGKGN
jgi:hypothetical protein